MLLSRRSLRCFASRDVPNLPKQPSPIQESRKAFEKKRLVSLKENFSKLVMIATSDAKEIADFAKDLDELHKKEFNAFFQKGSSQTSKESDNIFLEEQPKN